MTGSGVLLVHSQRAGKQLRKLKNWPEASHISLDPHRDTLIHFLHPQCPCSIAGIEEFNQLLAQCGNQVKACIVIVLPRGSSPGWENTSIASFCKTLPNVQVLTDIDGAEAARCHALTSGQTYLVHHNGEIAFQGGITSSRGHAGPSAGRTAIQLLIAGKPCEVRCTPVFGCSL